MSWALSPAELWSHEALLETPGGLPGGGGGQDGGCLTVGQVATPHSSHWKERGVRGPARATQNTTCLSCLETKVLTFHQQEKEP